MNSYLEFMYSTPIIPLLLLQLVKCSCLKSTAFLVVVLILKPGPCSPDPVPKPQLSTIGFIPGPGNRVQVSLATEVAQVRGRKDLGKEERRRVLKPLDFQNNKLGEPHQELLLRCLKHSNLVHSFPRTEAFRLSSRERDLCNSYFRRQGQGQGGIRVQAPLSYRQYSGDFLQPPQPLSQYGSQTELREFRPTPYQDRQPEMKAKLSSGSSLEETRSWNFESIKPFLPYENSSGVQANPNHIISDPERDTQVPSLPSNDFVPDSLTESLSLDISKEEFSSVVDPLPRLVNGLGVVSLEAATAPRNSAKLSLSLDTDPSRAVKTNDAGKDQYESESRAQTNNEIIGSQRNPHHGSPNVLPNKPEFGEKNENPIKTLDNEVEARVGSGEAESNYDRYLPTVDPLDGGKPGLALDSVDSDPNNTASSNYRKTNINLRDSTGPDSGNLNSSRAEPKTEIKSTCANSDNTRPEPETKSNENNGTNLSPEIIKPKAAEFNELLHGQTLPLIESQVSIPSPELELGLSTINQDRNEDRATGNFELVDRKDEFSPLSPDSDFAPVPVLNFTKLMEKWAQLKLDSKDSKGFTDRRHG